MKKQLIVLGLAACAGLLEAAAPYDLAAYKTELAKYAATEADAKAKPRERARAKMKRLVLEMRTCEDAELEAKIAETRAFIEKGGELKDANDRVAFYLSTADSGGVFKMPDVEKLAEKDSKADKWAMFEYVNSMLGRCAPKAGEGRGDFTYARSYERCLDLVDAAIREPLLAGSRPEFERRRFAYLRLLGRRDEAFEYADGRIAATKEDRERRNWYVALVKAYRADAHRYAEAPSPAMLKKAEEMTVRAAGCTKGGLSPADCLAIAQMRLDAEDFAGAREYVLKSREGKPTPAVRRDGELILGDVAYAEEKWSEAADHLLPFFDAKGKGNNHIRTVRTVEALFGADRRPEAIPLVRWLSEEGGRRYRQSRAKFKKVLEKLEK